MNEIVPGRPITREELRKMGVVSLLIVVPTDDVPRTLADMNFAAATVLVEHVDCIVPMQNERYCQIQMAAGHKCNGFDCVTGIVAPEFARVVNIGSVVATAGATIAAAPNLEGFQGATKLERAGVTHVDYTPCTPGAATRSIPIREVINAVAGTKGRVLNTQFDELQGHVAYHMRRPKDNPLPHGTPSATTNSMNCNHANEVPNVCPCDPECFCRVQGSCQDKPAERRVTPTELDFLVNERVEQVLKLVGVQTWLNKSPLQMIAVIASQKTSFFDLSETRRKQLEVAKETLAKLDAHLVEVKEQHAKEMASSRAAADSLVTAHAQACQELYQLYARVTGNTQNGPRIGVQEDVTEVLMTYDRLLEEAMRLIDEAQKGDRTSAWGKAANQFRRSWNAIIESRPLPTTPGSVLPVSKVRYVQFRPQELLNMGFTYMQVFLGKGELPRRIAVSDAVEVWLCAGDHGARRGMVFCHSEQISGEISLYDAEHHSSTHGLRRRILHRAVKDKCQRGDSYEMTMDIRVRGTSGAEKNLLNFVMEDNLGVTPGQVEVIFKNRDSSRVTIAKGPIAEVREESVPGGFAARIAKTVRNRGDDYGHPSNNHQLTAKLWTDWLRRAGAALRSDMQVRELTLTAEDVCMLNVLQKCSRLANGTKDDSWEDIAGYTENVAMLRPNQRNRPKAKPE